MIIFLSLCFIGLIYRIFKIVENNLNINFLNDVINNIFILIQFNNKEIDINVGFESLKFLRENHDKYDKLVPRRSYDHNINSYLYPMVMNNFLKYYHRETFFDRKDFLFIIDAINADTTSAIGTLKDKQKHEYIKLIPVFYISNFIELVIGYFIIIIPFRFPIFIRKTITLLAEITGILSFLIVLHPPTKLYLDSFLNFIVNSF